MFSDRTYVTIDDVRLPAEGESKRKGFCILSQCYLSAFFLSLQHLYVLTKTIGGVFFS